MKMLATTFFPSNALSPFVEKYIIVESETERINRLLPDTSIAMAFRLRGKTEFIVGGSTATIPSAVISGLRKTPRLVKYSPKSSTLIVLFKISGSSALYKLPLQALFEESVALEEVIDGSSVRYVEDRLATCLDHKQRISVIENFLLSLHHSQDLTIANALRRIKDANGNIRIKTLANSLHLSQDAFEKRFRKVVGSSAKQFSMIIRMKSILGSKLHTSVTDLALTAGYFDSAHFNNDFKRFTGQTPTEFFSIPLSW
jgi:AraC-like DNA-binding protein